MRKAQLIATSLAALLVAPIAAAHTGEGVVGGFQSGFLHPIFGWDHLLAMLLVGIWGAQMGGRSLWTLPVTFPLVMAAGGFFGVIGIPFPFVEQLIAISVIVLGICVAFMVHPKEPIVLAIVGVFAAAHGHAHGAELPVAANGLAYGVGFVIATGLIHLVGIGFGEAASKPWKGRIAQATGAAMAAFGVYFLLG